MKFENLDLEDPYIRLLIKQNCEDDFLFFCQYMFWRIENQNFHIKFFHKDIARALEKIASGEITRLLINIPPRFGKTQLGVKYYIAWILAKNQKAKFIHTSYSQDLALDNSSGVKEIIQHEAYSELWNLKYKDDAKAKNKWYTLQGGGMYSAAHGGQITGFGAGDISASKYCGALIIDDPLKAGDEYSEIYRNRANTRYKSTLKNRLNNEKVPIIIIMQRLHEYDLSGYVLENENYYHIKIPALDKNEKSIWPERFSTEYFLEEKKGNARAFAGQYMQEPSPAEGNIININWFNYFERVEPTEIYQSWDTANKDGEENDYSACITWGIKDNQYYVLDVWKDKLQYPDLRKAMISQYNKWNPRQLIIEDKASGQQILQELRRSTQLPIVSYNPGQRNKTERMFDASIDVESGRVYLKQKAHWLEEFLHEIKLFPNGKYKDTGDAFSMFINWFKSQKVTYFIKSF